MAEVHKPQFKDLFKGFEVFVPANIASLIIFVAACLGSLLLILPGLVVAAVYMFTLPMIVDKRLSFWEAMEASRRAVWKKWFPFTLFGMIILTILMVGSLTIVGAFIAFPWIIASTAYAYRDEVPANSF